MDKKVIVLMSRVFPLNSSRAGEKTGFKESIVEGRKIHTIRDNFAVWAKKLDEIKKGGACVTSPKARCRGLHLK